MPNDVIDQAVQAILDGRGADAIELLRGANFVAAPKPGTVQGRCTMCRMDTPFKRDGGGAMFCLRCGNYTPAFETPDEAEFRTTVMLNSLLDNKDQEVARLEEALSCEIEGARASEREACARICDGYAEDARDAEEVVRIGPDPIAAEESAMRMRAGSAAAGLCAKKIRARGKR